jgi:hypothetical protein
MTGPSLADKTKLYLNGLNSPFGDDVPAGMQLRSVEMTRDVVTSLFEFRVVLTVHEPELAWRCMYRLSDASVIGIQVLDRLFNGIIASIAADFPPRQLGEVRLTIIDADEVRSPQAMSEQR